VLILEDIAVQVTNGVLRWDIEKEPTLTDINIKIKSGELVAVVGAVGSGKVVKREIGEGEGKMKMERRE
jgi:ABC-type transport system involved in cytochrome bd biosynthesis fused ATPase/permease subunit